MKTKLIIKSPQECGEAELSEFYDLVIQGGEVQANRLYERMTKAYKLVFVYFETKCIAVGAIKNPNINYKSDVFCKAKVSDLAKEYQFEIGYIYTVEIFRGKGIGDKMMNALNKAAHGKNCFATTKETNLAMHHILEKLGYSRLGKAYTSDRNTYSLVLFTKKS